MTTPPDAARLRAALDDHLESVMTVTDTDRELARFRDTVSRADRRRRVLAAAASLTLLTAGAAGYLALRDTGSSSTVPAAAGGTGTGLTGSAVLTFRGPDGQASEVTRQDEMRNGTLTGPVTLSTDDGEVTGELVLAQNAGLVPTSGGPVVLHGWGEATMSLDGSTCGGSWAMSYYRGSEDGGGSINLACDDGTVVGARLAAQDISQHRLTWLWELDLRLEDGFLVAG